MVVTMKNAVFWNVAELHGATSQKTAFFMNLLIAYHRFNYGIISFQRQLIFIKQKPCERLCNAVHKCYSDKHKIRKMAWCLHHFLLWCVDLWSHSNLPEDKVKSILDIWYSVILLEMHLNIYLITRR
jgi:hypothetical protein